MKNKDFQHEGLSRRSFLQLSTSAGLTLSAVSFTATLAGCAPAPGVAPGFKFLREVDLELFRALIPAVVGGHLPAGTAQREAAVHSVMQLLDATSARCNAPAQKALRDLFNLLNLSLTRRLTTGITAPWRETTTAEVEAFLTRWRESGSGLYAAGYRGLVRFIAVSFYGLPQSWPSVGYAGPLDHVYQAANA